MRLISKLFPLLVVAALSGCTSFGATAPAMGVAALNGGLISRHPTATALPDDARNRALDAEFRALQFTPAGETVAWSASGYEGKVVPTQVYRVGSQDCRGYTHIVTSQGASSRTTGTACQTDEGLWQPVV